MCIVCVLLDKGKINSEEARAALWEQIEFAKNEIEENHIRKLYAELGAVTDENEPV